MSKTYLVRLKPYSKRRGYLCRNFMTGGVRFTTRWKEVSARKARELEALCQPHDREGEIPLFDIKTREEALEIEEKERDESGKPSSRVKEAELVPDSKFRDDRPTLNEDGEIVSNVEPAEIVDPQGSDDGDGEDQPEAPAEPAPSLRPRGAGTRT